MRHYTKAKREQLRAAGAAASYATPAPAYIPVGSEPDAAARGGRGGGGAGGGAGGDSDGDEVDDNVRVPFGLSDQARSRKAADNDKNVLQSMAPDDGADDDDARMEDEHLRKVMGGSGAAAGAYTRTLSGLN